MRIKRFVTVLVVCFLSLNGYEMRVTANINPKTNHLQKTDEALEQKSPISFILNKLSHLDAELQSQKLYNKHQREIIRQQDDKIKTLETLVNGIIAETDPQPAMQYEGANVGCSGDIINLSCSGDKTILVLAADYGEYSSDDYCDDDDCCVPHPNDCIEHVIDNNPADWVVLKLQCDNTTECDYLMQASTFIQNCTVSEIVDYMTIYYTCLPENSGPTVAFTAYTERTREFAEGEVIRFEKTITNLGNYYHDNSSVFICPFAGLYQFSIFVVGNVNRTVQANIMVGGTQMVIAWADAMANTYPQASNSLFVECKEGQKVWIESSTSQTSGSMFSNTWKHSTFSGVMLKRFN